MKDSKKPSHHNNRAAGVRDYNSVGTTACDECRIKRIKCSPYSPCQPCIDTGVECNIIRKEDGRGKEAKRRALAGSIRAPQQALTSIIKILRKEDKADLERLVQILESGQPTQELVKLLYGGAEQQDDLAVQLSLALVSAQERIHQLARPTELAGQQAFSPTQTESGSSRSSIGPRSIYTDISTSNEQVAGLGQITHLLETPEISSSGTIAVGPLHELPAQNATSYAMPDGSIISTLFFKYRDAAREMIADGVPTQRVLGIPDRFDVELFLRDRNLKDIYDADSWACELVKKIENFDQFVLLAACALCTSYMRWSVLPTAENYTLMPVMMRPTEDQRQRPHRMSIDLVPHPKVRDHLLQTFQDWLSMGAINAGNITVGWNRKLEDAIEVDVLTGRRVLTQAFIEHVTNPYNWSMSAYIRELCPDLEEMGVGIRS